MRKSRRRKEKEKAEKNENKGVWIASIKIRDELD